MIASPLPDRRPQALLDAWELVNDPAAIVAAEPSVRHRAWQTLKSQRGQTAAQRNRPAPAPGEGAPFGGDAA